jgi:hypothetical protein
VFGEIVHTDVKRRFCILIGQDGQDYFASFNYLFGYLGHLGCLFIPGASVEFDTNPAHVQREDSKKKNRLEAKNVRLVVPPAFTELQIESVLYQWNGEWGVANRPCSGRCPVFVRLSRIISVDEAIDTLKEGSRIVHDTVRAPKAGGTAIAVRIEILRPEGQQETAPALPEVEA